MRALEALLLVVKKWKAFMFSQIICVVIIAALVFTELHLNFLVHMNMLDKNPKAEEKYQLKELIMNGST